MKFIERFFANVHSITYLVVCLLAFSIPFSAFSDDTLCINPVSYNPYNPSSPPPQLDGEIVNDIGWLNASQYSFLNGSSGQDGRVQLNRDSNNIYLSFEIKLPAFNNANTQIILLLGPVVGDRAKDWRIHIFPGSDSGNGINSQPVRIQAWKDSNSWVPQVNCEPSNDATCSTSTSPVEAKVTAASSGGENVYRVEVRLSIGVTGIAIPNGATEIKLAFNALRVYNTTGNIVETLADQLFWPTTASIIGDPQQGADTKASPVYQNWGTAILPSSGQACAGVQVKRSWINNDTTSQTLSAPIPPASSVTNRFNVEVQNTGTVPAGHVLATISAWRFGSTPYSTLGKIGNIGTLLHPNNKNPTASYTANQSAIAAGETRQLPAIDWKLTSGEYSVLYGQKLTTFEDTNVCSVIQLDVDPDPARLPASVFHTQIASRYFYWNIHMAHASVFRNAALLDTKGYDAPLKANDPQRFELQVSTREVVSPNVDELRDLNRFVNHSPEHIRMADAQSLQSSNEITNLPPHKPVEHVVGKFPRIPSSEARRLLEYVGGLSHYMKGAGFLTKTVCPYRHTGRYIALGADKVELMERAPCFEYWIYHFGSIQEWIDDLTVTKPAKLINNGGGFYSIEVPVGKSVELNTRIEAIERFNDSKLALWQWLLLFLIIILLLLFLLRRKP